MHVHADARPAAPVLRAHAVQQPRRRLLRLHAVHAHAAPQRDRDRELRLEHCELVRERRRERRQLSPRARARVRVRRVRGRRVRDAARAVEADLAEHRVREGGEVRAEVGEKRREGQRLGEVREQPLEGGGVLWRGRGAEQERAVVRLLGGGGRERDPVREPRVVPCRARQRACGESRDTGGWRDGVSRSRAGRPTEAGYDLVWVRLRERAHEALVALPRRHGADPDGEGGHGLGGERGVGRVAVDVDNVPEYRWRAQFTRSGDGPLICHCDCEGG